MKNLIIVIGMVLILGLTGCVNDGDVSDTPGDTSSVVNEIADGITAMEAFDIYMQKYPDAKIEEIEFDTESDTGLYVYEIEGYEGNKKYELKINSEDGSIVKEEIEDKDNHQSDGEITKADVEKIDHLVSEALKDAGKGAKLDEWYLEFENKILVLEIEVDIDGGDDIDYLYNIETGKLIKKDR